jgi:hypothetical protein
MCLYIVSRVWGSMMKNSGFWVGWLDLLALLYNYSHLQQLTIHGCLRLVPFLTELQVSSLLHDWLSSDFQVGHFFSFCGLLVNTPQLNTELCCECRMIALSWTELSFCNFKASRIETTISNSSSVTASIPCRRNVLTEPLSSNGLFQLSGAMSYWSRIRVLVSCCLAMDHSGFLASCHNIFLKPYSLISR